MRALIFDLDGTLVDRVYAHVFAWQRALAGAFRVYRDVEEPRGALDELGLLSDEL